MESAYIQGIERKIKEIAKDYKKKGYEVIVEPQQSSLPEFLKKFQVDLIARSEDDNVVIEVKSSGSKTDFKRLEELANIINSEDNWRFELVFTNPKSELQLENNLKFIDNKTISSRIAECKSLLDSDNIIPAFLLGWTVLEASSRIKLRSLNANEELTKKPVLYLMKSLYSLGVINPIVLKELEQLNQYRNNIIHGFESQISEWNVIGLIEIIEILNGEGRNTEIYDWISNLDLDGYEEIYCLYRSVAEIDDYGLFETRRVGKSIFVKSDIVEEELELEDENQQKKMLEIIEEEYMDGMDPEGFYGFHSAMEKDD
jgi:Holliday junction resolvase